MLGNIIKWMPGGQTEHKMAGMVTEVIRDPGGGRYQKPVGIHHSAHVPMTESWYVAKKTIIDSCETRKMSCYQGDTCF